MASLRLIRDSRKTPSWTLTLAIPACLAITAWFLLGGITIEVAEIKVVTTTKGGVDYAAAISVWLAFLAQRGWRNKPGPDNGSEPADPTVGQNARSGTKLPQERS